ncbi:uncharacterized protein A4U43_C04F4890 [Asparagus officinalis]|uniref:Cupin type-1 domain-containing protein n=1 Tax=Asparagus officinalis TaxID=4686 RepID=A0A5P1F129_ASPOF|nr:uncharacterized protein A4U43_C04F4890 [Asparagus officinalis]
MKSDVFAFPFGMVHFQMNLGHTPAVALSALSSRNLGWLRLRTRCSGQPEGVEGGAEEGVSDLPIARKASLHRFFEKRKDRINAKAPYQVNKVKDSSATPFTTPKEEENQPWLGLKPSLSSESGR